MEGNNKVDGFMEFLLTYGWAILVVLIAIAALAYFGVLEPTKFLPNETIEIEPEEIPKVEYVYANHLLDLNCEELKEQYVSKLSGKFQKGILITNIMILKNCDLE